MSTKRKFNGLRQYYADSSFFKKILLTYLICGLLPMIIIIGVFYYSTQNILLKQAYQNVEQSVITTGSAVNQSLQPYQTLMEMLKNDKSLYIHLNMDYSKASYSDLANYTDQTLEKMMAMYPNLKGIHFYSNNVTLPDDQHYFFLTGAMDSDLRRQLDNNKEQVIISRNSNYKNSIAFVSRMNYQNAGINRSFLEFQISESLIRNQLQVENPDNRFLLIDKDGLLVMDSEEDQKGTIIQELVSDYDQLSTDEIHTIRGTDGKQYICMKSMVRSNLVLMMLVDRSKVLMAARILPLRMISVLGILLVLLTLLALFQSQNLNERLKKILDGLRELGEGHFDEKIEPLGKDEFGVIAKEVNRMGAEIDHLIQDNYEKQLIIKSTELNLLQEQINPHFLYNALAVISSLSMRENGKETVKSIRYLADFYRISLNKGRKVITVAEEIALLNNYMKIQLLRFSDLVEIYFEVEPDVEQFYTIKLLLQPLVENSIHHAREEERMIHIHVRAYESENRVCFDVEDDGVGIPEMKLKQLQEELLKQQEGFGLKNVDKRIKLAYGQEYGVTVFSEYGKGCRIHLEIPKISSRAESGVSV